ncbi:putative LRR receptor-like serine/threonine-protein kinase, partial [Ananas comosus]
ACLPKTPPNSLFPLFSPSRQQNLCGPPLSIPCSTFSPPSPSKNISLILLFAIIVISLGVLLVIIGLIMVILARRRQKNKHTEQIFQYTGATANNESSDADDEAELGAISHQHGGHKRSHKEEKGKLVFVRERKQRFEIEDLLRASAEILGSGNFGSSYKANLFDGPAVVVKRFREMKGLGREEFQEYMRRLGRLSHPNLVPLVAYMAKKDEKLLVTEHVPNGSLAHMLHGNRSPNLQPLDWPTRLKVIKGVAKGLLYLHEELPALTVPHGHLKSSNVLLNESYEPVLSDYGLVPVMSHSHASQVMVAYKSPEFAKYGKLSKKSDVWSFGILILEILTGNFPTIYLKKGNSGPDPAMWIGSIVREECTDKVFDAEMLNRNEDGRVEMMKLLNIGLSCCEEDVHKRLELKEAIKRIEEVRERDIDDEYSSFVRWNSSKSRTED